MAKSTKSTKKKQTEKSSPKVASQSETVQETQFFSPVLRLLILGILFCVAFGIRAYHITEAPLGFHPGRQYNCAIIARSLYFEASKSIPEWRKQIARINRKGVVAGELPIYGVYSINCLPDCRRRTSLDTTADLFDILVDRRGYFIPIYQRDILRRCGSIFHHFLSFSSLWHNCEQKLSTKPADDYAINYQHLEDILLLRATVDEKIADCSRLVSSCFVYLPHIAVPGIRGVHFPLCLQIWHSKNNNWFKVLVIYSYNYSAVRYVFRVRYLYRWIS